MAERRLEFPIDTGFFSYSCDVIDPFNTTPEKFENAALFLRLGLPSTLIRHEYVLQTGGI